MTAHHDPAVARLIEQARAEGAAEVVATMERLVGMQGYRFCGPACHGEALAIARALRGEA